MPTHTQRPSFLVSAILLAALTLPLAADDAPKGFLADFQRDFDRASKKLVSLAEATPADAFGWRPTKEVRSVSEVFIHVAESNFYLARDLGVPLPDGAPEEPEKNVTAKDDVLRYLKQSQVHVRQAVALAGDVEREIELFGRQRSVRSVFMIVAGHSNEHLGQAIAYARTYGLVPPWSQGG